MKKLQNITHKFSVLFALIIIITLWYFANAAELVPVFMLPSPWDVAKAFVNDLPTLLLHARITLQEAAYGLLVGIIAAFIIATVMERFAMFNRAMYPVLVLTQTIPIIAIAPLLVLWMGFGMAPKITVVAITTFFPIAVNLLDGYRSADPDAIQLLRSMGANRQQMFFHIKLPAALSHFFSGLRIATSYAVIGAVIAEWLGGTAGLGVYMTRVQNAYAFDKMFAVILLITVISILLIFLINFIRSKAMPWERVEKQGRK